jgi:nitrogen fixation protein NifX
MALQRHMRIVDHNSDSSVLDTGLKVAFATTDMKTVNQHFGSAQSFSMYVVNPEESILLEAAQFGKLEQDGDEDKLAAKISMLGGCAAVFCQAIGSSAIRQLVMKGIQPVKVAEGAVINDLIEVLQDEMRQGPSAWLAKAIAQQQGPDMSRFDEMEDEGWEE